MKTRALIVFLVCSLLGLEIGYAQQTGDVDTTFRISRNGTLNGVGTIYQVLVQPDQKVLALGNFTGIGSYQSPYLLRFHTDGRVDTSFRSPFLMGQMRFSTDMVLRVGNQGQLLESGKILVSGQFDSVGIFPNRGISILNNAGVADTSFHPYRSLFNGDHTYYSHINAFHSSSGSVYTSALVVNQGIRKNVFTRLTSTGDWDQSFPSIVTQSPPTQSPLMWKISQLSGHRILVHSFTKCHPCMPDEEEYAFFGLIYTNSGQINPTQPLQVDCNTIPFIWAKEDSGGNIFSYVTPIFDGSCDGGLVKVNEGLDTISKTAMDYWINQAELMDGNELIGAEPFYSGNNAAVVKIFTKPIPTPLIIGGSNNSIHSITRNASNQAYLAGNFTQYNGQPYPKLVRIHNFKTVTGVSPTLESSSFSLSPNPSSLGQCLLQTGSQDEPIVSITDHLGRNVPFTASRQSANSFQLKLDNPHSSTGIYLVRLSSNKEVKTLKWLVSGE